MLYRVGVILLGGGYIAYRVSLALQILKAKRSGDLERERRLRTHGFGLYRWAAGAAVVVFLVLVVIVWSNSR
ncbi:MAG TPA: hypothetical protein VH085_09170 [Nocardioides sp.]|nr:hypothetical protein [Nocardioides sp.]